MGVVNHFFLSCRKVGINEPYVYIKDLYVSGMSGNEVSEFLFKKYGITVSTRHITDVVKKSGKLRTKSEAKLNAMKRGRMVYRKKPEFEKYSSKVISAKTRLTVLTRDNFRCTVCGNSPKEGYSIEIHHKDGPSSEINNLQTLCFMCHRGTHAIKKDE